MDYFLDLANRTQLFPEFGSGIWGNRAVLNIRQFCCSMEVVIAYRR